MARDPEQILQGLLAGLPTGWAWPHDRQSVGAKLLNAHATELGTIEASMQALLEEADPRTADAMLDDWERAFGLPDECASMDQLVASRRAALLARIVERRSPTPANLIALAASYGVDAAITEHRPHVTESNSEDPVTDEDWAFVWDMLSPEILVVECTTEDDTEMPLEVWPVGPHECAVRRMAPAHTLVRFGTYKSDWDFTGGLPAGATLARTLPGTRTTYRGQ
ncbi:DUF2313 domain-containing protein, partial [Roseomonas sp. HJA6]